MLLLIGVGLIGVGSIGVGSIGVGSVGVGSIGVGSISGIRNGVTQHNFWGHIGIGSIRRCPKC